MRTLHHPQQLIKIEGFEEVFRFNARGPFRHLD